MTLRSSRSVLLAMCLCVLVAVEAMAAPGPPPFGPFIEDGASYEGQTKCSPWAKPGVVAFQRMVLAAYPGTGEGSIGRDCSIGGTSEHKEGRAWDWGVNARVPSESAAAEDLLDWLREEDEYGNKAAMARRLGVMYAIWNKRIWFPGSGWRIYCVERNGVCRDPDDGGIRHPHTDHVHFSFTWGGAKKKTTYWNTHRSYAAAATRTSSDGMIVLGLNGGLRTFGEAHSYGSKSSTYLKNVTVAIASTPAADGYWILNKNGRVFPFGNAQRHGSAAGTAASDLASTPSGGGYWILGRGGGVFPLGDAVALAATSDAIEGSTSGLATTPSGAGYWVLHDSGAVESYGDAQHHGNGSAAAVDIASTPTGAGYWVLTASGEVETFGDAQSFGGLSEAGGDTVAIVPTSTGDGYWLVTASAELHGFGDAAPLFPNPIASRTFSVRRWLGAVTE